MDACPCDAIAAIPVLRLPARYVSGPSGECASCELPVGSKLVYVNTPSSDMFTAALRAFASCPSALLPPIALLSAAAPLRDRKWSGMQNTLSNTTVRMSSRCATITQCERDSGTCFLALLPPIALLSAAAPPFRIHHPRSSSHRKWSGMCRTHCPTLSGCHRDAQQLCRCRRCCHARVHAVCQPVADARK